MFYHIDATVVYHKGNRSITKQIPTFYLNSDVQGIVDAKHAENIAKHIIDASDNPDIEVNVCATPIESLTPRQ